jgi:hypothetical protein
VEENPDYEKNSTVNVGFIRGLCPRYAWTKTFVFVLTMNREIRIVVFCTPAPGTPTPEPTWGTARGDERETRSKPSGQPFSTLPMSSCSQLYCDPSHTAAGAVRVCSLPETLAPPPESAVTCTSPTVGQRTHKVEACGGARTMRKFQLFLVVAIVATLLSTAAFACPAGSRPCGERNQLCCPAR